MTSRGTRVPRRPTLEAFDRHLIAHGCAAWVECTARRELDDADDAAVHAAAAAQRRELLPA